MSQWVKTCVAKPDNWSLTHGTHREGDNDVKSVTRQRSGEA